MKIIENTRLTLDEFYKQMHMLKERYNPQKATNSGFIAILCDNFWKICHNCLESHFRVFSPISLSHNPD